MIEFRCPGCLTAFSVPPSSAGKRASCPRCRMALRVPEPAQPLPAPLIDPAPAPRSSRKWVLVLFFGLLTGGAGFVSGVIASGRFGWSFDRIAPVGLDLAGPSLAQHNRREPVPTLAELLAHPFWLRAPNEADLNSLLDRVVHPGCREDFIVYADGEVISAAEGKPLRKMRRIVCPPRVDRASAKQILKREMDRVITEEAYKAEYGPP